VLMLTVSTFFEHARAHAHCVNIFLSMFMLVLNFMSMFMNVCEHSVYIKYENEFFHRNVFILLILINSHQMLAYTHLCLFLCN